jgi:putative membrane protein
MLKSSATSPASFNPLQITRPVPALLKYYFIVALGTTIAFPITALYLFFKYETLKYRFDEEGVTMWWGILFRKEITLAYRRIQDIHVSRNIVERWMGLATVAVQTASGASGPQMQVQGVYEYDALRDFLYMKMRGAKGLAESAAPQTTSGDEHLTLLREIRDEVARLRRDLHKGQGRS